MLVNDLRTREVVHLFDDRQGGLRIIRIQQIFDFERGDFQQVLDRGGLFLVAEDVECSDSQGNDNEIPEVSPVVGIVIILHIIQVAQILVELVDGAYFLVCVVNIINDPTRFRGFRKLLLQQKEALWLCRLRVQRENDSSVCWEFEAPKTNEVMRLVVK